MSPRYSPSATQSWRGRRCGVARGDPTDGDSALPGRRWQLFWGTLLESQGGGIWDCPLEYAAILVRQGLPTQQVKPQAKEGKDAPAAALWHSTR